VSALKNYGRKCQRYQCYHKYWDGQAVSYGPNYYASNGNVYSGEQGQAANQAAYGNADQAAAADAYASDRGAAGQYGAQGVGAGFGQAAYGAGGFGY